MRSYFQIKRGGAGNVITLAQLQGLMPSVVAHRNSAVIGNANLPSQYLATFKPDESLNVIIRDKVYNSFGQHIDPSLVDAIELAMHNSVTDNVRVDVVAIPYLLNKTLVHHMQQPAIDGGEDLDYSNESNKTMASNGGTAGSNLIFYHPVAWIYVGVQTPMPTNIFSGDWHFTSASKDGNNTGTIAIETRPQQSGYRLVKTAKFESANGSTVADSLPIFSDITQAKVSSNSGASILYERSDNIQLSSTIINSDTLYKRDVNTLGEVYGRYLIVRAEDGHGQLTLTPYATYQNSVNYSRDMQCFEAVDAISLAEFSPMSEPFYRAYPEDVGEDYDFYNYLTNYVSSGYTDLVEYICDRTNISELGETDNGAVLRTNTVSGQLTTLATQSHTTGFRKGRLTELDGYRDTYNYWVYFYGGSGDSAPDLYRQIVTFEDTTWTDPLELYLHRFSLQSFAIVKFTFNGSKLEHWDYATESERITDIYADSEPLIVHLSECTHNVVEWRVDGNSEWSSVSVINGNVMLSIGDIISALGYNQSTPSETLASALSEVSVEFKCSGRIAKSISLGANSSAGAVVNSWI